MIDDATCIIGSHTECSITSLGRAVTYISWVLVALDIWLAVVIRKHEKLTVIPTDNNAEERDETII